MISGRGSRALVVAYHLEENPDDLDDEDEDVEDTDEDEDDDDDEEPDPETWQVTVAKRIPLNVGWRLTRGSELPRLTMIYQLP